MAGSIKGDGTVVERGPHYNIVESLEEAEVDGQSISIPHRYTELGSGLNYWSVKQQSWAPSTDIIEVLQNGAVYHQGPYRLLFASNINDPNGHLEWFPAEDSRIVIQTIGLAITEEATGDSVWVGQIKDAQGFLTAQNEVTWPACFDEIDASVRVRVRPSGFENDIVLYEQLPPVGFRGACRLEAWHQIISGPEPETTQGWIQRGEKLEADTSLRFGQMMIGPGTAFRIGGAASAAGAAGAKVAVAKEYFSDPESNMRFLIESVPLSEANKRLRLLPPSRHALNLNENVKARLMASRKSDGARRRPMALRETPRRNADTVNIAAVTPKTFPDREGFLLDFSTLVTITNQIFAGNTTYLVASNNTVNISGTTTIEPGTVVKFGQSSPGFPSIVILGTLDCQTKPYSPAIFTSREDRTVGDTTTALTATINTNVSYGQYHLLFQPSDTSNIVLHNIRSLYASNSFGFATTNRLEAWNIQASRIGGNVFELAGATNILQNVLAHYVNTVVSAGGNSTGVKGEHFTIHTASKTFYDGGKTGCSFSLANSLLIGVTNSNSSGFTSSASYANANDAGIFQGVGNGAHYLADASPHRNAGSTSISTNLTQDIFKYSTTYPPLMLTNTVASDTVLNPQAPRDTDAPDLGYHYPAIDWAVSGVTVNGAVALTLTNGVAVATFGTSGFALNSGSKFISEGRPLNLNRMVRYNTVQEQPAVWGSTASTMSMLSLAGLVGQVSLRLTEVAHMAYAPASTRTYLATQSGTTTPNDFTMRDCEIYSSSIGLIQNYTGSSTISITNNLFHRSAPNFFIGGGYTANLNLYNNLFRYASISFYLAGSGTWGVRNNLFDNSTFSIVSTTPGNSHNGYANTTALSGALYSKTVGLTDYQTGVQGRWYYPASGTTNLFILVDAGSTAVTNTGLTHHSVRADHTKDTGTADIGYHYVAIDTSGPMDNDGDGIPDYLEDRNGNGSPDTGESDWTAFTNGSGDLSVFNPLQP